jgi:Flp pilus assembly protein TadG
VGATMQAGHSSIFSRFRRDGGGNFSVMGALMAAPIILAGMAAVDAANLIRTRTNVQHALDAAGLAVGKQFGGGAPEAVMREYGEKYFAANLRAVNPADVQFNIILPGAGDSEQQLSATADFTYDSLFCPIAAALIGRNCEFRYHMVTEIRVRNTVEVALVLDNSGSMDEKGTGSNKKRIDLLKIAAVQLVENMAQQASRVTRVDRPVQFSLVPFAAAVNVGPQHANASWMDRNGLSSIHYENFDISKGKSIDLGGGKRLDVPNGRPIMEGSGWPASLQGKPYTRFSLFQELRIFTNRSRTQSKPFASWLGCVEARPGRYNLDDTTPNEEIGDTLFVPMFAPDEYDPPSPSDRPLNNWWADGSATTYLAKRRDIKKYFTPAEYDAEIKDGYDEGPNYSCTTRPIMPLTDVSTPAGLNAIRTAINAMSPLGATNVPEGMAWGWRTVSSSEPFTEGRSEAERGNDKVVIVLTDGANTYYTYNSLGGPDRSSATSSYSAFGYTAQRTPNRSRTRIFENTSKVSVTHTNENYTAAMNEQFAQLCDNAKDAKIIVMTVALDLNKNDREQKKQIDALKTCSSDSRARRDPSDPSKPAKLFWNTTGGDLEETFRQIGDELSNLRIVK